MSDLVSTIAAARAWIDDDPDPATRAELAAVVDAAGAGDAAAVADLADRFAQTLQFGTAGLRGRVGAGPNRMNRAVVRRAAAGLGRWLLDEDPSSAERGVVVGFDARHGSIDFAHDTVGVLAAMGVRAHLLPGPLPTPVTAFAIRYLGAAAGVMVTASHNPPQDNGYKVYLGTGGQIVPPVDHAIAARIAAVGAVRQVPLVGLDDPRITRVGREVVDAYLDAAVASTFVASAREVRVAYTALHGVGRDTALAAFARAGFPAPLVVADQGDPDPDFPTVAFPNPEEPGAMDHLLALAAAEGCDLAVANDPDADRLGVAVPDPDAPGGWRALRGDQIGWLLAEHVLAHTTGDDRLVVTTVVSSSLLGRIAAAHGVHHAEVLTGFKWIAHAALGRPDLRFVFGYEEALGFLVGSHVLDKDGIGAALVLCELAALARAEGTTLLGRLHAIEARYGAYRTGQHVVRMAPSAAAAAVQQVQERPPAQLAGRAVTEVSFRADADLLTLRLGEAGRVMLRPSGTEPKLKIYAEAVDGDPAPLLAAAAALVSG